ncbi:MAG: TIGR02391 family protein [Deltaproteobacteria bacterium]
MVNIVSGIRMGAATTFKLAAYEAHKDRPAPAAPAAALPKIDEDARAAFDRLPIHPDVRAACGKQFADGHYREAVLNAGIALVDFVKQRAGNPTDNRGALDGTPLMQRVFGSKPPILKVNDLKTPTDEDEQQGMQFLFAGATLGLRNPRAHSLDPDTAEYAAEAIALISFLYKVAEASKT